MTTGPDFVRKAYASLWGPSTADNLTLEQIYAPDALVLIDGKSYTPKALKEVSDGVFSTYERETSKVGGDYSLLLLCR